MNRWISCAIFFVVYISQALLETNRTLIITSGLNRTIPVWMNDIVIIEATDLISNWFFNNITIAELNENTPDYNYSNSSPLKNITAFLGVRDSFLNLHNVNHVYTGIYEAQICCVNVSRYSLDMVVHEVNLLSIAFAVINDLGSCKAYLIPNDVINPRNSEVIRMPYPSDLIFNSINPSNRPLIEIINSDLNTANNNINTTIDIQYTFTFNNFSTVQSKNISLSLSLILQPTITIVGTSNNRTVSIRHNTTVECVRNIIYCLNTSDTESECNYSINLNELILKYPANSTFAKLSIVYDIIYVKYSFDINITQTIDEANGIIPQDDSGSLAGWQLALIIVGSIIGFILLLVIIIVCCCLWKKKSRKTSDPDKSSKARPSSNEHVIRRAIPPSEPANRQRRPSTPNTRSASLERTEQRERRQSSSYDHYLRPTIPQPTSKSYDSSSRQDVLYARPQTRPLNHERFPQLSTFQPISPSFDPKYQLEVPRDRRRPLESNDDDIILRF